MLSEITKFEFLTGCRFGDSGERPLPLAQPFPRCEVAGIVAKERKRNTSKICD